MRLIPGSMKQYLAVASGVLLALTILAGVSQAQEDPYERWDNGVSEPWWFAEKPTLAKKIAVVQTQWNAIGLENMTTPASEWVGDYFRGSDTHGSYLRWSPKSGFVLMNVDKCQAMVMGMDYGRATAKPALVEFIPDFDNHQPSTSHRHSNGRLTPTRLLPVKWRGGHYLIPESEIGDFGDYVAGLGKYNDLMFSFLEGVEFFYKLTDRDEVSAKDPPTVPPGYAHFIKDPISARITTVRSGYRRPDPENEWWDQLIIPVVINAGSKQGVKHKMLFRVPGSAGFGDMEERIEVNRVGSHSSQGVIVRTIRKKPCARIDKDDDCSEPEYRAVTTGASVTTSPF